MSRVAGCVILALALPGCREPARELAGPAGAAAALELVEALALRFGETTREPAFDALRPKLAAAALVPSRVWDDEDAWPRRAEAFRAVDFTGYRTGTGYALGVREWAPEPTTAGQYRAQLSLERIAGGRYEWRLREELAVGAVGPAALAAALDALFRGAERSGGEAGARAALASAFPRAAARLGRLLSLEQLSLVRDEQGATRVRVALRLHPARLREEAPHYAAFLERYVAPMELRVAAEDASGAEWWTLDGVHDLWVVRLRLKDGSLVPLEGEALRRVPERLVVKSDYATRMGRFSVAARGLEAELRLTRSDAEKGFVLQFRKPPRDWELPFLVEPLLGGPLRFPFEEPGSEAGWAAVATPSGTRLVRHFRARVAENFVLRWLGGMTARAVSSFRAGAEREAERYYGECLRGIRDDLAELLRAG